MNFSIAYGKTVHGFMKDWNCTESEARNTVDLWYKDRPEVRAWQKEVQRIALEKGWTQTLLGRYRNLTKHLSPKGRPKNADGEKDSKPRGNMVGHGLRAAINTPIQGGAADIVIAAMIKLHKDPLLLDMGYKLLLQIHDEVILEGPEEHSEMALQRVIDVMEAPLDAPLKVKLEVDAKVASNWYDAK